MAGRDITSRTKRFWALITWAAIAALVTIPLTIAAFSPYLPSRNISYIIASFSGIAGLGLFLVQPLLAAGYLPGLRPIQERKWHRRIGTVIIICVAVHVGGLFLTSPPDTIDALLLASPTPFSVFGVTAMWGVVLTAILVAGRKRLGLRYPMWQIIHNAFAMVIVLSTVVHAVQIEGTMGIGSKWVLCTAVMIATCIALIDLRLVRPVLSKRRSQDAVQ